MAMYDVMLTCSKCGTLLPETEDWEFRLGEADPKTLCIDCARELLSEKFDRAMKMLNEAREEVNLKHYRLAAELIEDASNVLWEVMEGCYEF